MATKPNSWYIERRIATPDGEYPYSEALHLSVFAYVEHLEDEIENLHYESVEERNRYER